LRASERPIAIACLRLVTFLPDLPLFSVPSFRSCIAFFTLLRAVDLDADLDADFLAVVFFAPVRFADDLREAAFFAAPDFDDVFLLDVFRVAMGTTPLFG